MNSVTIEIEYIVDRNTTIRLQSAVLTDDQDEVEAIGAAAQRKLQAFLKGFSDAS